MEINCWVLASIENPDYPTKITPSRAALRKSLPSNKDNALDWTHQQFTIHSWGYAATFLLHNLTLRNADEVWAIWTKYSFSVSNFALSFVFFFYSKYLFYFRNPQAASVYQVVLRGQTVLRPVLVETYLLLKMKLTQFWEMKMWLTRKMEKSCLVIGWNSKLKQSLYWYLGLFSSLATV